MPSKRYKRKSAYALSRQLRRRFYIAAAIATTGYVLLSLVKFHAQVSYLSQELAIIWAISLLCYASFREVLRWNDVDDRKHRGEIWAGLVLVGAIWMVIWNIFRAWILHLPAIPFPGDYVAATGETIVLYTLSTLSSFLYERRESALRRRRKTTRKKLKLAVVIKNETVTKKAEIPEVGIVLTKSPAAEEKDNQNKNS